jgi:tetratricopeptide (TPR) repeat protein
MREKNVSIAHADAESVMSLSKSLIAVTLSSFLSIESLNSLPSGNPQTTPARLPSNMRRSIQSAESLLSEQKFAEAAKEYEAILKLQPGFQEAHFALGVCYTQLGRRDLAEAALKHYLRYQPSSAEAHAILGILQLEQGRLGEARKELTQALHLDQEQSEAQKALARICLLEQNFTGAIALLHPLEASLTADDEVRFMLAGALERDHQLSEAQKLLDRILSHDVKSSPEVYLLAVNCRLKLQLPNEALDLCEKGLRVHPNSDRLQSLYVSLLRTSPSRASRTATMQKRLEKSLDSVDELIFWARMLIGLSEGNDFRRELAEGLLARAVRLEPQNSSAQFNYGRCLRLREKPEQAKEVLTQALSFNPAQELQIQILMELAQSEDQLSRYGQAEAAFRQGLQVNRDSKSHNSDAAFTFVRFLSQRSRSEEMEQLVEEILRWEPSYAPARLERAKLLVRKNKPQESVKEATKALEQASGDVELEKTAHIFLAKTYFSLGRTQEAQSHQEWIQPNSKTQPLSK